MKTLAESLFDSNIIEKDIKFGNLYELDCVHMQSPHAFKSLNTKRLLSDYSKYANKEDLNRYWYYYGADPNWKTIPPDIEKICNVFIGIINDFNMAEANEDDPIVKKSKYEFGRFYSGTNDALAVFLRRDLYVVLRKYAKGYKEHRVYIDSNYDNRSVKYRGDEYIQIKLGKENYQKNRPDYLELIFKKK